MPKKADGQSGASRVAPSAQTDNDMDQRTEQETSQPPCDFNAACRQRLATGVVGALIVAVGAVLLTVVRTLAHPSIPTRTEYVWLLILAFVAMAVIEVFGFRIYRIQFDFSLAREVTSATHHAVFYRMAALLITLALAWGIYWVLGEYGLRFSGLLSPDFSESWYAPFFRFFVITTVALPILAVPYFYLCSVFGKWTDEEDELLKLWAGYKACLRLRKPDPGFRAAVRSLCVKLFFVPVMTVFLVNNAEILEKNLLRFLAGPWVWDVGFAGRLFSVLYEGMFFVDVNIAVLGYVCCFRILDTHIRSAEPTLFGWAVALACYPPFNTRITGHYLAGPGNAHSWAGILSGSPWLYCLVGAAILLLVWVYLYSTLAFAFRFSNLTHRGIICRGPYAWVRHPAYAAKNLSWWLLHLPFLASPTACARLLLLNVIYVCRAITEERHLSRDPVYREYMKRVKWRFIPGVI